MNPATLWKNPAERRKWVTLASGLLISAAILSGRLAGWVGLGRSLMVGAALLAGDEPVEKKPRTDAPLDPNAIYLATPDATRRYGLSWDYLRSSGLKCYRLGHRTVLWKAVDLEAHIAKFETIAA